jgi:hypothetical protein
MWPFDTPDEPAVGADQPLPKWTRWRTVRPPPDPVPCDRCKVDARGAHILVGNGHYCLACGIREAGKAQR